MVYDLVRTIKFEHVELVKNAASALFQVRLWNFFFAVNGGVFDGIKSEVVDYLKLIRLKKHIGCVA